MANKITVTSLGTTANVNATPDSARYYSDKSKEWAISDKIVNNEDYSSKYYANESKKQADISTAKTTEVIESGNTAVSNIENARDNAITNVNTAGATQVALATEQATIATNKASEVVESGNTALSNIDTAKDNAITSITNQETTSKTSLIDEGATQVGLIQNEGATQIANVQSTGFYMRDDKLYFINSQGEETEFKSGGSGLEVCDIGMSLYVDETKGLRRYLNGQIVDINTNTQAFLNRLKEITTLHPSLLCTEDEWQTAKTMSAFGQVGKFVFNYSGDEIVSVRLPRVVNVQGLFDLQNLGMTVAESLPNITGSLGTTQAFGLEDVISRTAGAFEFTYESSGPGGNGGDTKGIFTFDASRSSSTYQDGAHVQQEAIQYPYFIQIATGSETENNIINEIELNNPYSLFDSKYSDHKLNNLSWLKSEGQWNAKAVYPTAYDELLKEYNNPDRLATFNKNVFEVVGSPTITDDGIASGFSGSDYITLPISLSEANSWQIILKNNSLYSYGYLLGGNILNTIAYIKGAFYISSNGTSWDVALNVGTVTDIPANSLIQLEFTGSKYISKYSTDNGLNWNITGELNSNVKITDKLDTLYVGVIVGGEPTNCSIDLKQFSITVDGVKVFSGAKSKVKLSTETYTDYDFVLNTADETFRLPLKTKLASGKAIVGNGITLGLTDGTHYAGIMDGNDGLYGRLQIYGSKLGTSVSTTDSLTDYIALAVTPDPEKSGIETSDSGLYLYFYVGETVQNANLIDAGRIGEQLANKIGRTECKAYITETYINGTSWYRVYSDGWIEQGGMVTAPTQIVNITLLKSFTNTNYSIIGSRSGSNDTLNIPSSISTKLVNSFEFFVLKTGGDVYWKACGY